jgi:hypothetical protein
MENKTEQKFITRRQAASRWQCSVMTLKRREAAGILTPYHLGRGVRYLLSDIEKIEEAAKC